MTLITKKIVLGYYEDLLSGKKKFDLRLNDFKVEAGDILELVEIDENRKPTGRKLQKTVTSVRYFKLDELFWSEKEIKEKGLQILSLE